MAKIALHAFVDSCGELDCVGDPADHSWRVVPALLAREPYRGDQASSYIDDPAGGTIKLSHRDIIGDYKTKSNRARMAPKRSESLKNKTSLILVWLR